ncbi:MAG: 30S ribosomal protein S9 [Chloroflexi bacterium]|nr:30S ribosomal protein S9 [Chloroflexota bacterium]
MVQQQYYQGLGKRKTAIAQVRLHARPGPLLVNGKPLEIAFPALAWKSAALRPLTVTDTLGKCSLEAKVVGGGPSSQAGAVSHGIARALLALDPNLKGPLRQHGLLTRDARIKESKKYGLKRARKRQQYSKR